MARNAVKLTGMVYGTVIRYPVQSLWREEALISTIYVKNAAKCTSNEICDFPVR